MAAVVKTMTFKEMEDFLNEPESRIIDSRMLEQFDDFGFIFQVLVGGDQYANEIWQVYVKPEFKEQEDGTHVERGDFRKEALDLFRLAYRHSPRMNPALYGLADAKDAASRVENTSVTTVRN